MTDIEPEPPRRRSLRRVGVFALGGAAAAAVVAIALLLGPGSPGVAPGPSTGPGVAQCVETYSLETLRNRGFAFDGNVTAVDGDEVTFAVNNAYRGPAGEVTLTAMGMTGTAITSAGGPNLAVGSRYLVAGDDHFVWACGFTQDYNPAVAAAWADALGG